MCQSQIKKTEDELKHAFDIKIINRSIELLNKWGAKYNTDSKHHDRVASTMLPKVVQFYNDVKNEKIDKNLNPEWLQEMHPEKKILMNMLSHLWKRCTSILSHQSQMLIKFNRVWKP